MYYRHAIFPTIIIALVIAVDSHNGNSMREILDTPDFSEAVVHLAKLWKTTHSNASIEFSISNMEKLRVQLAKLDGNVVGSESKDSAHGGDYSVVKQNDRDKAESIKTTFSHPSGKHSNTGDILEPVKVRRERRHARDRQYFLGHMENPTVVNSDYAARIQRRSESQTDPDEHLGDLLDTELPSDYGQPRQSASSSADGNGAQSSCPTCIDDEEAKRLRLEAIKRQILTKLRLSSPPNISKFANVENSPAIARLINQHQGLQGDDPGGRPEGMTYSIEDEDFYAKPMRVIHIAENLPQSVTQRTNTTDNLCYFTFQETVFHSRIQSAKLSVYIRPSRAPMHRRRMTVMLLHTVGLTNNGRRTNTTLVETKNLDLRQSGRWHSFDVRRQVIDMIRSNNFGIFKVEAYDHSGRPVAVMRPLNNEEKNLVPYLDVRLKERPHRRRSKRHFSRDCDATSREERCCRYPFIVDFEEFGWDFIRQPRRFNAFYCRGACEMNHYQHTNAHGHLVEQANPYASAGPCCVPSKLSGRSILYRDDNGTYIYGIIPGMSVEKCGCA